MNKEEILYNEIYERTKDFGRTHFIKEIMRLQKELEQLKEIEKEHQRINGDLRVEIKELKEKYMKLEDKYIHNVSCCNEEDCDLFCEHQELKDRIDKAFEIIDLIKPELWNISNKMTYRLLDVKTTLKGDKE